MKPENAIADGAEEIRQSIVEIFPDIKLVMCWAHASKKMKEHLDKYVKDPKMNQQIYADILKLQLSQSQEIFSKAAILFLHEHRAEENFVNYFKKEWIDKRTGWYEGVSHMCPSTNNAQEATHRAIKLLWTMHNRIGLKEMGALVLEIIFSWSNDLGTDFPFANERTITAKDKISAYIWVRFSKNEILQDPDDVDDSQENWYVKTGNVNLTAQLVKKIKNRSWKSFQEFKKINFEACCVTVDAPRDNENYSSFCDCRTFFKDYKCVHSLGIAMKKGYLIMPPTLKALALEQVKKKVPIESKGKRGRRKKAVKPLLID